MGVTKELLLFSAHELTDDEAGGHGNRWGVFSEDVEALIGQWLGLAVQKAEVSTFGMGGQQALEQVTAEGEPAAVALLYTGQEHGLGQTGLMSLIHQDPGGADREPSNELWSAFPFFGEGLPVEATVERVRVFPNHIEARLTLALSGGALVFAFDTGFSRSRAVYQADERYRFMLSALAYHMQPAVEMEHVIDDEQEIRSFRARNAWVEARGSWREEDEASALTAWQPQSPADLEPIRISMGKMSALMPSTSGPADDAEYFGEVRQVIPGAVRMLDVEFWRVDAVVMRSDEELVIPIYVAENLFEGDWRPQVGQYVCGTLWMQAYACERAGTANEGSDVW